MPPLNGANHRASPRLGQCVLAELPTRPEITDERASLAPASPRSKAQMTLQILEPSRLRGRYCRDIVERFGEGLTKAVGIACSEISEPQPGTLPVVLARADPEERAGNSYGRGQTRSGSPDTPPSAPHGDLDRDLVRRRQDAHTFSARGRTTGRNGTLAAAP